MKPNGEIHFFDLDGTLWNIHFNVWVIDKEKPHKPIIKLGNYETHKILNGLYIDHGNKIDYNGETFFISNELLEKIQKKRKIDLDRLGLSWIEALNTEYINNSKINYLLYNINHLKNENIIILTGRSNRRSNADILNKLRLKLKEKDIDIFKIYFVGDKFFKRHNNSISINKTRVLLEHLVGVQIEDGEFIKIKQDWFDTIYFYDDEIQNINYANDINKYLNDVLQKTTDVEIKDIVLKRIEENDLLLINNLVTNNQANLFKTYSIKLIIPAKFQKP